MPSKPLNDRSARSRTPFFWLVALGLVAGPAGAGEVVIGNGSSISSGSGQIEPGCADIEIAGGLSGSLDGARNVTFSPGADVVGASVGLSGDWVNNGPQALDVFIDWRDGCGVSEASMLGSSNVPALSIDSESGREIRFDAAGEQRVSNSLSLTGAPGELLRLRSTNAGQLALLSLEPGGSQLIDSVNVAGIDSRAGQSIAPGHPSDYNSEQAGPVRNWFALPPVPIPTLGLVSTILFILLMILFGLFHQRRQPSNIRG